ncbi:uncharacterized protein TNCV_1616141 [Trichonephila clavipes]|nr:uncharacterized protein TNCV_1616141 [Trichonephila clavipes]
MFFEVMNLTLQSDSPMDAPNECLSDCIMPIVEWLSGHMISDEILNPYLEVLLSFIKDRACHVVADTTCLTVSDRGPRNSSWQWARGTPVVDLSLEHHTNDKKSPIHSLSVIPHRVWMSPLAPNPPCFMGTKAGDKSLRRHCCRVSDADKGWRIYPLDRCPDAVALYSGCTPDKRRAWFLPVDRHTASFVGLRGGWRRVSMKLCFAHMDPSQLCPETSTPRLHISKTTIRSQVAAIAARNKPLKPREKKRPPEIISNAIEINMAPFKPRKSTHIQNTSDEEDMFEEEEVWSAMGQMRDTDQALSPWIAVGPKLPSCRVV